MIIGDSYFITGSRGGNYGYAVVNPQTMKLIHSAWCQRITNWSKFVDNVIDQKYHWDFVDWLTGQFAQMIHLKMDEAPFIFDGTKFKTLSIKELKAKIAQSKKQVRDLKRKLTKMHQVDAEKKSG